jgi:hypothetical protein
MPLGFDAKLNIGPVNYTPPRYLASPQSPASATRAFQGIPAIAKTGGRLWVAFYGHATATEGPGNFGIVKRAGSGGAGTWTTDGYVTWPDDDTKRVFDGRLWCDPAGHLWQFWTASGNSLNNDGKLGVWCSVCENPEGTVPVWSRFFMISPIGCPTRPFMVGGVAHIGIDYWAGSSTTTAIGKHVYEFDYANRRLGQYIGMTPAAAAGETFDETSRAELPSGAIIAAVRNSTDALCWSTSIDGMASWSALGDWSAPGNSAVARAAIATTAAGRLVLVHNNSTVRERLRLLLSDDEGATFPRSCMLDVRLGTSYPDIEIDGDDIYVAFDFERTVAKQIFVTKVSETAVWAGTATPTTYTVDDA